ncbi:MAG: hypothetical protein BMS9Abin37_1319 [Acidobacteriota bacterium]|nr:MAG: hypothetical protein BMS9Abin37_1319 [Acidobacteriota bacterium]
MDQSVAIVTGTTPGIGLATAYSLAERRCKLVLSGRRSAGRAENSFTTGITLPVAMEGSPRSKVAGLSSTSQR